jgi:glycosyltransferase involved in cell wall biosynthesis
MRILVIVHQFPPKESAGTEVYAYKLAKGLQERGHDLAVYTTQRYADRQQYELNRREYDGLPVFEVVNNHEFGHFRGTYKDERMEERLRDVLDEFEPDVVHVQHLHLHSIDYVSIIKDRGIPVLYTLAEYLNICSRTSARSARRGSGRLLWASRRRRLRTFLRPWRSSPRRRSRECTSRPTSRSPSSASSAR